MVTTKKKNYYFVLLLFINYFLGGKCLNSCKRVVTNGVMDKAFES